jgi:hypothetical protein
MKQIDKLLIAYRRCSKCPIVIFRWFGNVNMELLRIIMKRHDSQQGWLTCLTQPGTGAFRPWTVIAQASWIHLTWVHCHSAWSLGNTKVHKKNSVVLVRERTTPTELPPLVGEVSAKLLRKESDTWLMWRILTAVFSISRPEPLFFLPSSSSIVLTRLGGPCSRPTNSQKIR